MQVAYSAREGMLQWTVPLVDQSNSSATMEFSVAGCPSADSIFPISVAFASKKMMCELEAINVLSVDTNTPIPFSSSTWLSIESYTIN